MSRPAHKPQEASHSNFIRAAIDADIASGKHAARTWGGKPGPARVHEGAPKDPARIRTRFPPEPNGYLHIGHAKSICLNFGLALDYRGACHLRFDDTNPEKEEQEYVDSIVAAVKWLGFSWEHEGASHLYYASDYFDFMYHAAECLIEGGHAYVDSLNAEQMRALRGTLAEPGKNSPYRDRGVEENLKLFRDMRDGRFKEGEHVLRAKIDMASPNINMRDPAIYRIRKAAHHRTGDKWCVYPMYTYAHPIEDALECITHSLCTLEFEDQRPFYDWLLERLAADGLLQRPVPQQIEFARLNLTYVVLSKRKLIQLVEEGHVDGWDDPRMPTLAGARRRGYTPEGLRLFAARIGVAKSDSWIDYSVLENCMREHLNEAAQRRIAVLDPLKMVIENYPDTEEEECEAPNHPQKSEWGKRKIPFSRELWIEREDFSEVPAKGFFRLFPGNKVRLRYAYVVECTGYDPKTDTVKCRYFEDSKSGSPTADTYKVKGNIHWLSARHSESVEVRLYDRLFRVPRPGIGDRDFLLDVIVDSVQSFPAHVEPALLLAKPEERFQFERYGYFVSDLALSRPGAPVFNRIVTLRDSWANYAATKGAIKMPKVTEPDDEVYVEDEPPEEEVVVEYDISVNNSDPTLTGIEEMWKRDELIIPDFQREFVWDIRQSSKLIESFLLGLPVPQIFLYTDNEYKNLVIDGQQRIRSILYFFEGYFGSESIQSKRQVFRLQGLDPRSPYFNSRFVDLDEVAQRKLRSATLHTVTIRQLKPKGSKTSIYHIFERLNTGGTALKPQEIRNCVFRGEFMNLLRGLNQNEDWRRILGKKKLDKHQKDIELLLRIFSLSDNWDTYEKPMKEFLNKTMTAERGGTSQRVARFAENFPKAASIIVAKLGDKPFHVRGPLNSSALDSVFCTVLDNLKDLVPDLREKWEALKSDKEFEESTYYGTSDVSVLTTRFNKAQSYLVQK